MFGSKINREFFKLAFVCICLIFSGCKNDDDAPPANPPVDEDVDLTSIPYSPQPMVVDIPAEIGVMDYPEDNPQTVDGVMLGRMLFFDPILSRDSTISCASCHRPELSFTDGRAVSVGVDGREGRRSSMSLLNIGLHGPVGLFWDGRRQTLEQQALDPIIDPVEMDNTHEEVEKRLRRSAMYREQFRKAFGITMSSQIDRSLLAKAIAQFERTLVSSGQSEYNRHIRNEYSPSDEALNGKLLFFDEELPDAECGHCHNDPLFAINNKYVNNGLDPVASVDDYRDKARGEVTGNRLDNAKFKVPSLRNIMLTAPYMHDGRFQTIEEVIDHYNSGGHHVANLDEDNVDNLMEPQGLSERDKRDLIEFLKTLTDSTFIANPDFYSPF